MKIITALETQKGNPGRVNVFLNNKYAFAVRLIDAAILQRGQTLNPEEISRLKTSDEFYRAYRASINYLTYRARSQREIERHLKRKGFSSKTIFRTIDRLRSQSYIDDLAFARTWVKGRISRKPASRSVLGYELTQKGIDDKIIKQVMMDVDDGELARACAEKKLRLWGNLEREDFSKKILNHLKRKGFNYEVSRNACRHARYVLDHRDCRSSDTGDQASTRN